MVECGRGSRTAGRRPNRNCSRRKRDGEILAQKLHVGPDENPVGPYSATAAGEFGTAITSHLISLQRAAGEWIDVGHRVAADGGDVAQQTVLDVIHADEFADRRASLRGERAAGSGLSRLPPAAGPLRGHPALPAHQQRGQPP